MLSIIRNQSEKFSNQNKKNNFPISYRLILRISYVSEKALYKLGKKSGCCPETEAMELLQMAKMLNLNVVGLSFHIGSSVEDNDAYCRAIEICKKLFVSAFDQLDFKFNILDIGGGFPGESFDKIDSFAGPIDKCLNENFPIDQYPNLQIISEPGRYFVETAFTLVTMIHSRRIIRDPATRDILETMYYLNEGIFSHFLSVLLGPEKVTPWPLVTHRSAKKFNTTVWGKIIAIHNVC